MASNVNKTKILKFVDGADPAKGGFLNIAELMHDVVKQMTNGGGFVVRHCSTLDTIQNTTPWGTINGAGQWVPGAAPPLVGSPPSGSHKEINMSNISVDVTNSVSISPRATITLEAGGPGVISSGGSTPVTQATWVDYLNPVSAPWTLPVANAIFDAVIVPNPEDGGVTGIMTVNNPVTGLIQVGQMVTGPGIVPSTTITALGTGINLSGTYIVTPGQAIQLQQLETITGPGSLSFKGYINGTVLSVTSVTAGTIAVGNTISGNFTGTSPTASIAASTTIVRQLSAFGTAVASTTIPGVTTTTTTAPGGSTTTTTSATTTTAAPGPVTSLTVSSATGVAAGQLVAGAGIPLGTFVAASYTSGTTINLVDYLGATVTLTSALSAGTAVRFFTPGKAGTYVVSQSQTIPAVLRPVQLQADTVARYNLLNETWRVRFELLNNECVAAYVGTPLQLPGWADATTFPKTPESWGVPGSVAKLTDPRGVVVDSAGAIGARQFISTCYTAKGVSVGTASASLPNTATAITADGTLTLTKAGTFKQGSAVSFTNTKVATTPLATPGTVAILAGQTYYVVADVLVPSTTVQITDTYANALASTKATFTASAIASGTIALDASPSSGKGFTAGDVIYIKDPIFTVTEGYTGTIFLKVDAVDTFGAVLSLSILQGGALVRKSVLTDAEKARAPAIANLGIPITGSFYNLNSGRLYSVPVLTTTTTAAPSGPTTTTTTAPSLTAGGTGLLLAIELANSVPNVGPGAGGYVDEIDSYQGFYNRGQRVGPHGDSYPLKYYLSISNNGFFLGIFESNWATTVGGTGTFSKFTAALVQGKPGTVNPPLLYAQNVLGTITPGMLLTGDTRVAGGTRILDYPDPNVLTDPLAGNGDSGRYILSASPSAALGVYNTVTKLIQGDLPTGRTVRNPPIQLQGTSGDSRFNWMMVQRPVNRTTGVILDNYESLTSKHPVFCLNSVAGRYYHFSVREKDISHPQSGPPDHTSIAYYKDFIQYPTPGDYDNYPYRVPSGLNSEDSHLLFNPQNQISLTEDKTYLISFPNNLTTPRFRYTEEIDMIGFTSSDILMSGQVVSFATYDEPQDRIYIALPPSNRYNTGVRFCVLKQTGNI